MVSINNQIRIVHVLYSFETGGLEKGIATLVRKASPEFEHAILCMSTSGKSEGLLPLNTQLIELHKRPGNSPSFLLKLSRVIKGLRPHIVHTRNWGGVDGIVAARLAGISSVVHGEHGWEVLDPNGHNPRRILIRRILSRCVREYTCVSKHIKAWLGETVRIKKPISQIYNGVDTEMYSPNGATKNLRAELTIPLNALVIGCVGRLDPIKDHPTLFRAFEIVQQQVPNAVLLTVGDGILRQRLDTSSRKGIMFLGNRSDVPAILTMLDVFVLASRNEGISNTILEAMASAVPVVVTNVGGNPEIVEHERTGFLVEPGDAQAMAKAILLYADNPELRLRHGQEGRKRVLKDFTIENMVRSYEAVYRRVTAKKATISEALPGMP